MAILRRFAFFCFVCFSGAFQAHGADFQIEEYFQEEKRNFINDIMMVFFYPVVHEYGYQIQITKITYLAMIATSYFSICIHLERGPAQSSSADIRKLINSFIEKNSLLKRVGDSSFTINSLKKDALKILQSFIEKVNTKIEDTQKRT